MCISRVWTSSSPRRESWRGHPAPVQPLRSIDLDTVAEALEELLLHALVARTPEGDQLLDFDYEQLERQLAIFLGPQPSQEDLVTFLFLLLTS
jgi:hypothetical protein